MAAAMSSLMAIGGGIIWKILGIVSVIAFSAGLFFFVKFVQKRTKKQKAFTITAVIVDLNGVFDLDMLAFVKDDESGMLEMAFQTRKSDSVPPIPKHLIKNGNVLLCNYAPGHYCVIDTSKTVWNIEAGKDEIVPFNLGMKNYILAKQRDAINRAERKKERWNTYAPWITLGAAVLAAVLLSAFLFFIGAKLEQTNITARIAECIGA